MTSSLEISILCDNTPSDPRFGSEWGFSACVKQPDGSLFLWDCGKSGLFHETAQVLGIDLTTLTSVALSHGHHDHAGGLGVLWDTIGYSGPIYGHTSCIRKRWKLLGTANPRMIGVEPEFRDRLQSRLEPVKTHTRLAPGLDMLTDIPLRPGFGFSAANYFFDTGQNEPDLLPDDAFLVLQTDSGPVVLFGCCHAGLGNSLYHAREILGIESFHAVIGGLHLLKAPYDRLEESVNVLREFKVEFAHVGHCTDAVAVKYLAEHLKGRVYDLGTGTRFVF